METNYYSTDQREGKNLLCTKCNVVSHMRKIPYGKKPNEFSWWCCNCEDKISQSSVMEIKDIISSHNLKETNHSQEKPGKESAPKELGTTMMQKTSIPDTRKGCGKSLGCEDAPFYCGKKCEWCTDNHTHYCDTCKSHNLNKTQEKKT